MIEAWMRLGGIELGNHARTVAYLRNGVANDSRFRPGRCDCEELDDDFTTPGADPSDWYVAARPESGEFLGFIPANIRLGPAFRRGSTATLDGAVLGPTRRPGRSVVVDGWMVAGSARGMDYGRRWLTEALKASCFDPTDLCLLPVCPTEGDPVPERYYRTLYRVGLVGEGPNFGPISNAPECFVSSAEFVLQSELGWLYEDAITLADNEPLVSQVCGLATTEEWIGDAGIVVKVRAGSSAISGVRVRAASVKEGGCPWNPISDAVAAWRAADYDGASQSIADATGNGHDLRLGATAGVEASDPLFGPMDTARYWLVGNTTAGGPRIQSADHPDFTVTNLDFDLVTAQPDWSPGANVFLGGKHQAGQISFYLELLTAGTLRLQWSVDGTALLPATSTANLSGLAAFTKRWLRVQLDVDNGAAGRTIRFYTSVDSVVWVQLGTDVVQTVGTTSIFDGSAPLCLGGSPSTSGTIGTRYYGLALRADIGGALVADLDIERDFAPPYGASLDSVGKSWSQGGGFNSSSSRPGAFIDRDTFLMDSDAFLASVDAADLDLTGDFTVVVATRRYPRTAARVLTAKKAATGTGAGYAIRIASDAALIPLSVIRADGTTELTDAGPNLPSGEAVGVALVKDGAMLYAATSADGRGTGTADALGSSANAEELVSGGYSGGTERGEMEWFGQAAFQRALSDEEIESVTNYLLGGSIQEPTAVCMDLEIDNLRGGDVLVVDGARHEVYVEEESSFRRKPGLGVFSTDGPLGWPEVGACALVCTCAELLPGGVVNAGTQVTIEQHSRES